MSNTAVTRIIAHALATGLVHPGKDGGPKLPLTLPMFRPATLPPQLAKQMADEAGLPDPDIATLTAEALADLLDTNGYTVIETTDLDQLRTRAAEMTGRHRQPWITCRCGTHLFRVNIDAQRPEVDGKQLIAALGQMNPNCPHGDDQ